MTDGPLHLVEVGLAWPPDSFLRAKLAGLVRRGLRVTVVTTPGRGTDPVVPGVTVVRLVDVHRGRTRLVLGALADCLRLSVTHPRRLMRAARAAAGLASPRGVLERLRWLRVFAQLEPLRPAVVHFEWESAAIRYLPLLDLWRCPMVMSCRGGLGLYSRSPTHRAALNGVAKAFERASAVHLVSEAMRAEASSHGLDAPARTPETR